MTSSTVDTPAAGPSGAPARRRWKWLLSALPTIAFLATFGFFFVDKNREARTVFTSAPGLLTIAAIGAGYLLLAFLLRRLVRWAWVAPVVLAAVVLSLAAWIVRPYYVDQSADRMLVQGMVGDAPSAGSPPAAPMAGQEQAAGPVRVSSGGLRGIGHDAAGSASIVKSPDGSFVVRFESFDIEGSPDPRVYLVQDSDARRPGGVELGRLRGNQGQVLDYPVPAGTSPGPGWTVLVWCRAFSVPIANATQAA